MTHAGHIAAALDARLEIRLVTQRRRAERSPRSPSALVRLVKPLFWDRPLRASDFVRHPDWVLARVLTTGDTDQVEAARSFFGDEAIANVIDRRDVDGRTRNYWRLILAGGGRAPQGSAA